MVRELAARVRMGQALRHFQAQFLDRIQETLADFFRLQQRKSGAQRHRVAGADRTDQHLASIGQADHLVPGREAVAGSHGAMLARPG
jgi:hypothetical protein